MKMKLAGAALMAALSCGTVQDADAAIVVTMLEVGSDVIATGGGTADTDGFATLETGVSGIPVINPVIALFRTGLTISSGIDIYSSMTGPISFGPGFDSVPTSGSGDQFGVGRPFGGAPALLVPAGYLSGAALAGTSTYGGQTFSSLGVTPGTYVWSWGTGVDADTFTLLIGDDAVAAARVPVPASALLLGLGVVAAAAGRARRSA